MDAGVLAPDELEILAVSVEIEDPNWHLMLDAVAGQPMTFGVGSWLLAP
jgi:hypothetical protein